MSDRTARSRSNYVSNPEQTLVYIKRNTMSGVDVTTTGINPIRMENLRDEGVAGRSDFLGRNVPRQYMLPPRAYAVGNPGQRTRGQLCISEELAGSIVVISILSLYPLLKRETRRWKCVTCLFSLPS